MTYYEILVEAHLDRKRQKMLGGLELCHLDGGKTLLSGWLKDQSELFSVLSRIGDMNLTLISVKKADKKMEDTL